MKKEIVEVPVLSAAVRSLGVPLSLVTKAKGMVFVSGMPPFDIQTGELVRRHRNTDRNIAEGAAPLPRSGRHGNGERRRGKDLCSQCRFLQCDQPRLCQALSKKSALPHIRVGGGMADGAGGRSAHSGRERFQCPGV